MEELYNYDIGDDELKHILEINNDVFTLSREEILERVNILNELDCTMETIKHVIVTNPYYLTNNMDDIKNLIKLMQEMNIDKFNEILLTNPFILNDSVYDVKEYIKNHI